MEELAVTRLRNWRESAELSLGEVGGLTGVSIAMLSRLERGQRRASPRLKVQMARRLGVQIPDLFEVEPLVEEDERV
jgi:transcriptional regulator with XRE-family HTH domain